MIEINEAQKHWELCVLCTDKAHKKISFGDNDGNTQTIKLCKACFEELGTKFKDDPGKSARIKANCTHDEMIDVSDLNDVSNNQMTLACAKCGVVKYLKRGAGG